MGEPARKPVLLLFSTRLPKANDASEFELTIKEYLLAKRQEQRSPNTIEKYELRLTELANWMARRGVTHLANLTRLLLREWGASLNPEWSPATHRHAISIVRGFLFWCRDEDLIDEKLAEVLRLPKVKARAQRTLSSEEIKRLLDICDDSDFGLRDAAIVSLMVDSGLRASEVCKLELNDLTFEFPFGDETLHFALITGKGGHREPVYFGDETAARLRIWLAVRLARPDVKTVFVSLGGNTPLCPLTRSGLGGLLEELGSRASVAGVSPHSLRRSFAVLLDEAGATTRQIQVLGRWSDIKMVERYTQAIRAGKGFNKFSPGNRFKRGGKR